MAGSQTNGAKAALTFADGMTDDVGFDPVTRLPMIHMFDDADRAAENLETALHACVSEETNQNLSPKKKWMLQWHWCLGHRQMSLVKWLARRRLLGRQSKHIAELHDDEHPMCASCNCGKQHRRPSKAKVMKPVPE